MEIIFLTIGTFIGAATAMIICIIRYSGIQQENDKLNRKIADLEKQVSLYQTWKKYYEYEYNKLSKVFNELKSSRTYSGKTEIPKGTIEAVKMAMKNSHPDNGGKEEDFIKFRRAYNVLTGKEKL